MCLRSVLHDRRTVKATHFHAEAARLVMFDELKGGCVIGVGKGPWHRGAANWPKGSEEQMAQFLDVSNGKSRSSDARGTGKVPDLRF